VSSFTTDFGIVHYEVLGRGRPVILLHGWLGSWGLWQETMAYLGRYYRTYAMDFWGFGESGKKRDSFAVNDFVILVDQFMEHLGIGQAPLVGHSMGGTVSLSVAIQYPKRVKKVVVVGSPIVGSSLSLLLKLFGRRFVAAVIHNNLWILKVGFRILSPLYTRDPRWPQMMNRDLSQTTLESFLMSIATLRMTDLRPELNRINIPVMGMYGDKDIVVNPKQWQPLLEGVQHARIERFNNAGHFIMLDDPPLFMEILHEFLDSPVPMLTPADKEQSMQSEGRLTPSPDYNRKDSTPSPPKAFDQKAPPSSITNTSGKSEGEAKTNPSNQKNKSTNTDNTSVAAAKLEEYSTSNEAQDSGESGKDNIAGEVETREP
jgi:pimeloyl-ACP methyl ester carboxylesterase